jgi:hypothetical protein
MSSGFFSGILENCACDSGCRSDRKGAADKMAFFWGGGQKSRPFERPKKAKKVGRRPQKWQSELRLSALGGFELESRTLPATKKV